MISLEMFLKESNEIENKYLVTDQEVETASTFLALPRLTIADVVAYVNATQPNAVLRVRKGLDVSVGGRRCFPGGAELVRKFEIILEEVNYNDDTPYNLHRAYEELHPFTDGNGRSGRLVWLWQMKQFNYPIYNTTGGGFLQMYYYQSFSGRDG